VSRPIYGPKILYKYANASNRLMNIGTTCRQTVSTSFVIDLPWCMACMMSDESLLSWKSDDKFIT
jgi:hypothetical protein